MKNDNLVKCHKSGGFSVVVMCISCTSEFQLAYILSFSSHVKSLAGLRTHAFFGARRAFCCMQCTWRRAAEEQFLRCRISSTSSYRGKLRVGACPPCACIYYYKNSTDRRRKVSWSEKTVLLKSVEKVFEGQVSLLDPIKKPEQGKTIPSAWQQHPTTVKASVIPCYTGIQPLPTKLR